jgi:hypothetical protein
VWKGTGGRLFAYCDPLDVPRNLFPAHYGLKVSGLYRRDEIK